MFCSNCGNEVPDNTRFCRNCGAQFDTSGSEKQDKPKIVDENKGVIEIIKEYKKIIIVSVIIVLVVILDAIYGARLIEAIKSLFLK